MIKQHKFSIRKFAVGASSIVIGGIIFLSGHEDVSAAEQHSQTEGVHATTSSGNDETQVSDKESEINSINGKDVSTVSTKKPPKLSSQRSSSKLATTAPHSLNQNEPNQGSSDHDTTAPQIIDVDIDKHTYAPGETVKARVIIKEAGQLSDVSIGFSNDTRVGTSSINEIAKPENMHKGQDGLWTVDINLKIPDKIGDTSFSFAAVVADDASGNGDTVAPGLAPSSMNTDHLKFNIKNKEAVDTEAPQILGVTVDKEKYYPGNTIHARVHIEDASQLKEVSLGFVNAPYIGLDGINKFAYAKDMTRLPDGTWMANIALQIPKNFAASTYKFSHVSAEDEYGNITAVVDELSEPTNYTNLSFEILSMNESTQDHLSSTQPNLGASSENDYSNTDINNKDDRKIESSKHESKDDSTSNELEYQPLKSNKNSESFKGVKLEITTRENPQVNKKVRDDSETPQSHQDDTKTSISGPHEKAKYEYKEESKTEKQDQNLPQAGKTTKSIISFIAAILLIIGSIFILRREKRRTIK